jgi:hypothetical protein
VQNVLRIPFPVIIPSFLNLLRISIALISIISIPNHKNVSNVVRIAENVLQKDVLNAS